MARGLRFVPEGHLVEVTCRTYQGRFLLRPCAISVRRVLGALARSQALYQMPIHAFVFLSNHYHLLVSPEDARHLARFMGYLNSMLAREIGRLHNWSNAFWARRYCAIPVSHEEQAQIERLSYVVAQGSKEGLVASPRDWPGATFLSAILEDKPLLGLWHDRSAYYNAQRCGRHLEAKDWVHEEEVILSPIPAWSNLSPAQYRQGVERIVELATRAAELEAQASGRRPLGVKVVLGHAPEHRPLAIANRAAPLVHAATRKAREVLRSAYGDFVAAYREAAERLKAGCRDVVFPVGCFPPPLPYASGPPHRS